MNGAAGIIACSACKAPIDVSHYNQPNPTRCPGCNRNLLAYVFPAFYRRENSGPVGEALQDLAEASCFQHSTRRAVAPCDRCGRFMCALCQMEIEGSTICPECLESGHQKQQISSLESKRILYDTMAYSLALAPLPMLLFYPILILSPLTAIGAIFVTIRHWNKPLGITRNSRWRFVVAVILAMLQLLGWGFIILTLAGLAGELLAD